MATGDLLRGARQRAILEAARASAELKIGSGRPVDVFSAIERTGVWLAFQKMDRLYGVYLKVGDTSGIIVNASHPRSLQRYTAAHELGHHLLQHNLSVDSETQILGRRAGTRQRIDIREIEAQTFAAYFLMPPVLVTRTLRELGLSGKHEFMPRDIYRVSLFLGASYTATVTHLADLDVIGRREASRLRQVAPKDIKEQVGRGTRPMDTSADLWPLSPSDAGSTLFLRINDELAVDLPEIPSSGYVWTLSATEDLGGRDAAPNITLAQNAFIEEATEDPEHVWLGGNGVRRLRLRIEEQGEGRLAFSKKRPWESTTKEEFDLQLHVDGSPTGESEEGLSAQQRKLLSGKAPE